MENRGPIIFRLFFVVGTLLASTGWVFGEMDDAGRATVLTAHNNYRSQLARGGQVPNGSTGQTLGPASNVNKLRYNMTLEQFAQQWTDQCIDEHSNGPYGENLYMSSAELTPSQASQESADSWWSEFATDGLPSLTYNSEDSASGHATQMAWGATTDIGCGYTWCPNLSYPALFVCSYTKSGNMEGEPVYEEGNPCQSNGECTSTSSCDVASGLCDSGS